MNFNDIPDLSPLLVAELANAAHLTTDEAEARMEALPDPVIDAIALQLAQITLARIGNGADLMDAAEYAHRKVGRILGQSLRNHLSHQN